MNIKNIDFKNVELITTITNKCKEQCKNQNGFYDGIWIVMDINYREKEVVLSNGRVNIFKKFYEINEITTR